MYFIFVIYFFFITKGKRQEIHKVIPRSPHINNKLYGTCMRYMLYEVPILAHNVFSFII